jgi:hypothetical protein
MQINGYDYISEQEFVGYWGAHAKPSGDLYLYSEVVSLPHEHVWTVTEGEDVDEGGFNLDGNWYATPGVYMVNALGYLIADRPWKEGTNDAIWYLDDDEQACEERRVEYYADCTSPVIPRHPDLRDDV